MRLLNKVCFKLNTIIDSLNFFSLLIGAVFEKSYLGSVSAMQLNGLYAAVLFDGKIQLHAVSIYYPQ